MSANQYIPQESTREKFADGSVLVTYSDGSMELSAVTLLAKEDLCSSVFIRD